MTAVLYSIFYSAVQLMASAALFNVIAGVPVTFGAIFMAFIVWFYVCTGGLKASTWVGVIQFVLLMAVSSFWAPTSGAVRRLERFFRRCKLESKYWKFPG
jgi:SSS family solute:Na+ symporter